MAKSIASLITLKVVGSPFFSAKYILLGVLPDGFLIKLKPYSKHKLSDNYLNL